MPWTRFPDVVAADGNSVPFRNILGSESKSVRDESHRRSWRENPSFLGNVFFEDVVLNGAGNLAKVEPAFLGIHEIHRPNDGSRRIDRHRSGDFLHINSAEKRFHVGQRIHCHATFPDFTKTTRDGQNHDPLKSADGMQLKVRTALETGDNEIAGSCLQLFQIH